MRTLAGANEIILFVAAILVLLSVVASRISAKLGVPALLLFLALGMLAGSEGPGGIYFDNARIAQLVGVIALALILFAGGLDTQWTAIRPVLLQGLGLSTLGVFLTALLTGWFVSYAAKLPLTEGLLLGSIVSSTDAAAVFMVMRSRNVNMKGNLAPLLELESGSNDPMAVFLTLAFIQVMKHPAGSFINLAIMFLQQMALGALLGYAFGKAIVHIVNRIKLEYDGLYSVLTLALVFLTYSLTSLIGGNGFLAVYLAGIGLGNSEFIHKRSLMRFHDGLAWLMQITMFLTLGLLVFPSKLVPIIETGLLVAAFLIFVARPVSVFATLLLSKMNIREKAIVSWVGLRGAVPIILATFPLLAGIPKADTIFNIVFFIVLTSALLQGTSIPLVARWLKVDAPVIPQGEQMPELQPEECISCKITELKISDKSALAGKQIVEAGLPENVNVLLIERDQKLYTPTGATVLYAGDSLLVLGDEEKINQLRLIL